MNITLGCIFMYLLTCNLRHHEEQKINRVTSSSGTELPLVVEIYGLLNDIFPFSSILDAELSCF